MDEQVKISAIVTCHDYGHYLPQCLDSLLAQTLPFHEIILIDDASTDETPEVAKTYQEKIRYVRLNCRNAPRARQHGVALSSGEFLVHIDADDFLLPEYNEKLVEPLRAHPSVGVSYCGFHHLFEGNNIQIPPTAHFLLTPFDQALLRRRNYIVNCSMTRKKAWLGQDPSLQGELDDWDHWIRVIKAGWTARLVPEKLFYYRVHERSCTQALLREKSAREAFQRVRNRHLDDDLTILTLFSGKDSLLEPYFEALARLRKPLRTQILFIDDSGRVDFFHKLRRMSSHTYSFPEKKDSLDGDSPSEESQHQVAHRLASVYGFAKTFIRGKRLLIWEQDVIPKPDALERLEESRKMKKADIIGAFVISRKTTEPLVWRTRGGRIDHGVYRLPLTRGLKRVFATSFSFTLMDSRDFFNLNLTARIEGLRFFGCDLNAGVWAYENNKRWFADGSVRCAHIDSDGTAVTLGSRRHIKTGPLKALQEGYLPL